MPTNEQEAMRAVEALMKDPTAKAVTSRPEGEQAMAALLALTGLERTVQLAIDANTHEGADLLRVYFRIATKAAKELAKEAGIDVE